MAELHPIKRHQVLFEAVRTLTSTHPSVRLLCFGDGQLRDELETWIVRHGMEDHIFVLGTLHEAARFLKAFDAFVLASKSESYGYVLHEAGLAGVPIVATNVGGIPDIITHEETGLLVPSDDASALSAALYMTLEQKDETSRRSEALLKKLTSRDTRQMAQATTDIYLA